MEKAALKVSLKPTVTTPYLDRVEKAMRKPATLPSVGSVSNGIKRPVGLNRGALLNKIAEFVTKVDTSLPYRRRVEVAIFKDGKVLLTKNKDKDSGNTWYGFPGGGTDGDTDSVAAKKECLEEIGVKVKNLEATDILHTQEGIGSKEGRDKKYRGSRTKMFVADYDGKDLSILEEGSRPYIWSTVDEAKKLLRDNKVNSSYRVKALSAKKDT